MLRPTNPLCTVDVAEGYVVEYLRELSAFDVVLIRLVDVGLLFGVVARPSGKKVAGGDDGCFGILAEVGGGLGNFAVMTADSLL